MDYQNQVWKLVARYVAREQDREDLFQEVFLAIHRALPRFRGEATLSTWIYRLTVNTAINFLKKQNCYKGLKDLLVKLHIAEVVEPWQTDDLTLFKPLEKLNPQQRMIVLLADVEEYKLEEIAQIMKLPIGTVKSTLHRAREILKKEVEKHGWL